MKTLVFTGVNYLNILPVGETNYNQYEKFSYWIQYENILAGGVHNFLLLEAEWKYHGHWAIHLWSITVCFPILGPLWNILGPLWNNIYCIYMYKLEFGTNWFSMGPTKTKTATAFSLRNIIYIHWQGVKEKQQVLV